MSESCEFQALKSSRSSRKDSLLGCRSPWCGRPAVRRAHSGRSPGRRPAPAGAGTAGGVAAAARSPPTLPRPPSLPRSCSQLGGPLGGRRGALIKARSCHPEQAAHRPGRAGASGLGLGSADQPWPPPTGLWKTDSRMGNRLPCRAPSATWR